jgi:hypothetical protein
MLPGQGNLDYIEKLAFTDKQPNRAGISAVEKVLKGGKALNETSSGL